MRINKSDLEVLKTQAQGDPFFLCSRQGAPNEGWEMVVDVRGIPAILKASDCSQVYGKYLNLASINANSDSPVDPYKIYAEYGLNMLMQCRPQHRNVPLEVFLQNVTWDDKSPFRRWVAVGDHTIGRVLMTQEFHKQVLDRMWDAWVTTCAYFFQPSVELRVLLRGQAGKVRGCVSKSDVEDLFQNLEHTAETNWLSKQPLTQ